MLYNHSSFLSLVSFIVFEVWCSCSFYEFGKVGQQFDSGVICMPDCVWPLGTEKREKLVEVPGPLWKPSGTSVKMSSNISCIKMYGKHFNTDGSPMQHVLYPSKY